jgi:hypothetical protein
MSTKVTAAHFGIEHDGKQYTASMDWADDGSILLDGLYNHTDETQVRVQGWPFDPVIWPILSAIRAMLAEAAGAAA